MKQIIAIIFILVAAGLVGCQPMYWPGTQAQRAAAQPKPPKQNLASAQTDAWNDAREKQLEKQREAEVQDLEKKRIQNKKTQLPREIDGLSLEQTENEFRRVTQVSDCKNTRDDVKSCYYKTEKGTDLVVFTNGKVTFISSGKDVPIGFTIDEYVSKYGNPKIWHSSIDEELDKAIEMRAVFHCWQDEQTEMRITISTQKYKVRFSWWGGKVYEAGEMRKFIIVVLKDTRPDSKTGHTSYSGPRPCSD